MKNRELADIFAQMADLMEILDQDRFRVNSYRRAGRIIEELSDPIEGIAAAGKLEGIEGVGKGTAAKIQQYLSTGKIEAHQELLGQLPLGVAEMLSVPGLGPKTVANLWKQGGITSIGQLKRALVHPGQLDVQGIGEKKAHQILESLAFLETTGGRALLGEAQAHADALIATISRAKGAKRVQAAGSLRRGRETIGDIDLLCEASTEEAKGVMEQFTRAEGVRRVLAAGATKSSVVLEGDVQADLRVVEGESFGAALMYFTGSKDHNVRLRERAIKKGLKLNEYGLFKGERLLAGADEKEIYAALGLQYIPPELREDRGEIALATEGKLPRLIELKDIRGDFHMHTTASDGENTIEEMIQACRSRGYAYMAICDHSKGQAQAGGLDEERLAKHISAIRAAGRKHKDILVLAGSEVDIFKDGSLDYADEVLAGLDFVIASPHSALSMKRQEATARLIKAMEKGLVHCIGHPSGRLINSRPGMELDIATLAAAAAAHNVALEVNADYRRLDLRDIHVRAAIEAGAKLMICTDAHSTATLDMMGYGVATARRGWATAGDVVNTYSPAELKKWLNRKA